MPGWMLNGPAGDESPAGPLPPWALYRGQPLAPFTRST